MRVVIRKIPHYYEEDIAEWFNKSEIEYQLCWLIDRYNSHLYEKPENDLFTGELNKNVIEYFKERLPNIKIITFEYSKSKSFLMGIKKLDSEEDDDYFKIIMYDGLIID